MPAGRDPVPFLDGASAAIATMHGKETAIAPALTPLGLQCALLEGLDTDRFGTFSGTVPRAGTMLDAARAKTRAAFARCDADFVIASEGAFGPHPAAPLLPGGRELIVFTHRETGVEIVETLTTFETNYVRLDFGPSADLEDFLARAGFPEHGLLAWPVGAEDGAPRVLESQAGLDAALGDGLARLETDMRAHRNPTRMGEIARLAERLAARLSAACPKCNRPGFGVVEREPGLPCSYCGTPTLAIARERCACSWCGHEAVRGRADGRQTADPADCPVCNP